ncbi:hypothetical protein ABZ631_12655 [Nocardiopsis alba]
MLTGAFGEAPAGGRQRTGGHAPGRVITDTGGDTISYLAVLWGRAEPK